jgi:hypothetical protein
MESSRLPRARPTKKTLLPAPAKGRLSSFPSQKSTGSESFLATWYKSILAYSCFPIVIVGTSNGNHDMKTHKPSSDTRRRPTLIPVALRRPCVVNRPWAAGHESRSAHHSSPSPSTRVLIASVQLLETDLTCSKQTPKNFLIASFSTVFFNALERRCVRALLFLIGCAAIRNHRNTMKTNGGSHSNRSI